MPSDISSANITAVQFEAFSDFISRNYSRNSLHIQNDSEPEKGFYGILFKDLDLSVKDQYCPANNFWIRMLRDHLAKNINLGSSDNQVIFAK